MWNPNRNRSLLRNYIESILKESEILSLLGVWSLGVGLEQQGNCNIFKFPWEQWPNETVTFLNENLQSIWIRIHVTLLNLMANIKQKEVNFIRSYSAFAKYLLEADSIAVISVWTYKLHVKSFRYKKFLRNFYRTPTKSFRK